MSDTNFPEPNASILAELQAALNELDQEWDRDWPGVSPCPNCNHQLELDADFRCLHCGSSH
jgi:hypothetical protein